MLYYNSCIEECSKIYHCWGNSLNNQMVCRSIYATNSISWRISKIRIVKEIYNLLQYTSIFRLLLLLYLNRKYSRQKLKQNIYEGHPSHTILSAFLLFVTSSLHTRVLSPTYEVKHYFTSFLVFFMILKHLFCSYILKFKYHNARRQKQSSLNWKVILNQKRQIWTT